MAIKTQSVMVIRTIVGGFTRTSLANALAALDAGQALSTRFDSTTRGYAIIKLELNTDVSPDRNGMSLLAVDTVFEFPVSVSEAATVFTGGDVPLMRTTLRNLREQHGTV